MYPNTRDGIGSMSYQGSKGGMGLRDLGEHQLWWSGIVDDCTKDTTIKTEKVLKYVYLIVS